MSKATTQISSQKQKSYSKALSHNVVNPNNLANDHTSVTQSYKNEKYQKKKTLETSIDIHNAHNQGEYNVMYHRSSENSVSSIDGDTVLSENDSRDEESHSCEYSFDVSYTNSTQVKSIDQKFQRPVPTVNQITDDGELLIPIRIRKRSLNEQIGVGVFWICISVLYLAVITVTIDKGSLQKPDILPMWWVKHQSIIINFANYMIFVAVGVLVSIATKLNVILSNLMTHFKASINMGKNISLIVSN